MSITHFTPKRLSNDICLKKSYKSLLFSLVLSVFFFIRPITAEPRNSILTCPIGSIIYVDASASGLNDGSSWLNAFKDLQAALSLATFSNISEIDVAKGTYKPTATTDRTISFSMINDVKILGGFPSGGGARDWINNVTTLSGDIGMIDIKTDNSDSVVSSTNLNNTAILDGFTITGGYNNYLGNGGGLYNLHSSPILSNIIFSNNSATYYGGGMYSGLFSYPKLSAITFSNNSAFDSGGGLYIASSNPTLTNVTFANNFAFNAGGGMFCESSSPTLSHVTSQIILPKVAVESIIVIQLSLLMMFPS